jgi:transposase
MPVHKRSLGELFALHGHEYAQLQVEIEKVEARLMAWHRVDECSRRLIQIPGVGPIGALMMVTGSPKFPLVLWLSVNPIRRAARTKIRTPMQTSRPSLALSQ